MKINAQILQVWSVMKVKAWTKEWIVDDRFLFEIQLWLDKYKKKIWKWFITDYWSIPRLLWLLFNPTAWNTYILHDDLYKYWFFLDDEWNRIFITKRQADLILFYWMRSEWAWCFESNVVLLWLDIGWWVAWNRYRNREF